ncbi:hypothetical protein GGF31_007338 [Allomyces arbusculus]|nr:hypothetical protein GGF31_007338 [Allomyces arbusculus]
MAEIHEVPVARLLFIGPAQAGKTQLTKFLADQDPAFHAEQPLAIGGDIGPCTSRMAMYPVRLYRERLSRALVSRDDSGNVLKPLSFWVDQVNGVSDKAVEEMFDLFEASGDDYLLEGMGATEMKRPILNLELFDTPGLDMSGTQVDRDLGLTEFLQSFPAIDAAVIVIRYATRITPENMEAKFAGPFEELSKTCTNLIVVHSHYLPNMAVEAGKPYLNLSDRVAVFDGWLRTKSYGDHLHTTHIPMNKMPVPPKAYPSATKNELVLIKTAGGNEKDANVFVELVKLPRPDEMLYLYDTDQHAYYDTLIRILVVLFRSHIAPQGLIFASGYPHDVSPSTVESLSQYLAQYGKFCPKVALLFTNYIPHIVLMNGDEYLNVSERFDKITAALNRPDLLIDALPVKTSMSPADRAARIAFYYQQRAAFFDLLSKYALKTPLTANLVCVEMGELVKLC